MNDVSNPRALAIDEDTAEMAVRIQRASVAEIHVDFILWEELQTNGEFLRQFAAHCLRQANWLSEEEELVSLDGMVARSLSTAFGDSDDMTPIQTGRGLSAVDCAQG